jgi:hypothetical protein
MSFAQASKTKSIRIYIVVSFDQIFLELVILSQSTFIQSGSFILPKMMDQILKTKTSWDENTYQKVITP